MAITAYGVAGTANVDASHWARSHSRLMDAVMGGAKMYVSGMTATASGSNLSVTTGEVYQPGVLSVSDAVATVPVVANTAANPRVDILCLRTDYNGTSTGASTLVAVRGSAAANPVAPALTQDAGTLWFTPLFRYRVAAGASVASSLVDVRPGAALGFTQLDITGATWSQDPSASLALGVERVGLRVEMTGQITRTGSAMATGDSATFGGTAIIPDGYRPKRGLVVHGVSGLVANDIAEQRFIFQPDGTCTMWVTRGTLATGRVIRVDTTTYLGA